MWARILELILACWLFISTFILSYPQADSFMLTAHWACAGLIFLFSLLSFWRPLGKMHLFNIGIAFCLIGLGFTTFPQMAGAAEQNSVILGILLLILGVVPSHCNDPSPSWQKFSATLQRL